MNKNLEIIIRVNDKSEVSQDEIIFSKTVNRDLPESMCAFHF
jgi:hypothetical protein